MNINKQRILAILIVFIICFSIISPITVHAVVNYTSTGTKMKPDEWRLGTFNGPTYKIEYYYPVYNGVEFKYFIFSNSVLPNVTYFTENTVFENNSLNRVLQGEAITYSAQQAGWFAEDYNNRIKNVMTTALFETHSASGEFTHYINANGTTVCTMMESSKVKEQHIAYLPKGNDYYVTTSSGLVSTITAEESEAFYVDWYVNKYGFNPPLAEVTPDEEIGFMKGQYYAILSQESILDEIENGVGRRGRGFVETVDEAYITADTTYTVDGERRGLLYVVISSDNKEGDLIGSGNFADEGFWNTIVGVLGKFGIWTNITDMQRNNYDLILQTYLFHNPKSNLNRYYFSNLQDACKFVLYGTAGATPIYEEIGKTDYGYGYIACEYNNYEISGFPLKSVPMEQYPLGRQEIILAQHDVQGEGRKFVYVDLNYYSRVSMLDPDMNLIINNEYMQPEYLVYTQGAETLENAHDKSLYTPDESYKIKRTTTFPIYNSKTTDPTGTWDVIYSTYDYFQIKNGQIIDGDEKPPVIQIGKDENGNTITLNTDTNEVYKNGETDPYKYDAEKDKYINSKGEEIDLDDYTFATLEWQQTIKDYQDHVENLANLIEDFTGFINNSTEQVGEITGLLNAVLLSLPSIFRTLILMSFIALVCGRVIKRK